MVLNKILYDVRESLKQYVDDSEIDDRYIIYLYGIKRAKYLRRDLNDFQRTTDVSVTQTLCLELETVPIDQCSLNIDCDTIVRSKRPIPQPLELHIKSAIVNIRPVNRISVPFNFVTKEKAVYSNFAPFKGIYAFLDNDKHLYLISSSDAINLIECITVTAVFEDPLELLDYSNCCNCTTPAPCINYDTINYPLQPHYIDLIKDEIVANLIQKLQIPEDRQNDSIDD